MATLRECHCTTSVILQISVVEFDVWILLLSLTRHYFEVCQHEFANLSLPCEGRLSFCLCLAFGLHSEFTWRFRVLWTAQFHLIYLAFLKLCTLFYLIICLFANLSILWWKKSKTIWCLRKQKKYLKKCKFCLTILHCRWILSLECLSNKDCNTTYSTCDDGTCKCKDELIKEGKTCKHGEKYNFSGFAELRNLEDFRVNIYNGWMATLSKWWDVMLQIKSNHLNRIKGFSDPIYNIMNTLKCYYDQKKIFFFLWISKLC